MLKHIEFNRKKEIFIVHLLYKHADKFNKVKLNFNRKRRSLEFGEWRIPGELYYMLCVYFVS